MFLSYRRADMGGNAREFVGRLYDELAAKWGMENIFMDVDTIPTGVLFADYIAQQVARADVMLEIIGPQWAAELRKRHGDEKDFVRLEIESATAQAIPVVPVLTDTASLPYSTHLVPAPHLQAPAAILRMLERNAYQLRDGSGFEPSVARLIAHLEEHHSKHIEMVWCPPGTFHRRELKPPKAPKPLRPWWLFWKQDELGAADESNLVYAPEHTISLTRGFWIGKYPVTQAQWEKVIAINPSDHKCPENPVQNVSWEDAMVFCKTLSARDGVEYRLPTEAEWEYACGAGSTTAWCFGNDEARLRDYAWYDENSDNRPHPVGQKLPNSWGIHDMHGNIWEWCQDWYGEYPDGPATDPGGAALGDGRVLRGGCWSFSVLSTYTAARYDHPPSNRCDYIGFRLARNSTTPGASAS